MERPVVYSILLIFAFLSLLILIPWINRKRNGVEEAADDSLQIQVAPPYKLQNVDDGLADRIRDTINAMGGVGEDAEDIYQQKLSDLRGDSERVLEAVKRELDVVPEERHLDRWALIQLLAELKDPASVILLDTLLSQRMPIEKSQNPHNRSTLRQETIIMTTAIEAVTRIAANGEKPAVDLLRKHASHESLSVRRASIQGYLDYGGDGARDELLKILPKKDHYLLDIRRIDIRNAPPVKAEPGPTRRRKAQEVADVPRVTPKL